MDVSLAARLRAYAAVFNADHYHAAHDALEPRYREATGEERDLLQGLIQYAAAAHHVHGGNRDGATGLAVSALEYLDGVDDWPEPDLVIRTGASPTSKTLRRYLAAVDARQIVVDPAGGWREAEFTASDLVVADPAVLFDELADRVSATHSAWRARFDRAEDDYWASVTAAFDDEYFEGAILHDIARLCPDPTTLFVSNSMPVRDLDRFGQPRSGRVTALGNRGVSGIDGITSTALGAGSATDDPLVLVTGDIAYYHDMNGLLALDRCQVDATIVLINNDGGGIFHKLPIADFDPPFSSQFETPHDLDFEPTGDLYAFEYRRVDDRSAFREQFEAAAGNESTTLIEVQTDSERSHQVRERLHERICADVV